MTRAIGIRRSPRPRKSRGCFTYIEADAERIWPHARRRPTRRAATGVQVALITTKASRPRRLTTTKNAAGGFRSSELSAAEPRSTPEQKKSVALVPSRPPVGTA